MLPISPAQLREVARSVGALLAAHLDAPIYVVDRSGRVVHSTEPEAAGRAFRLADVSRSGRGADLLRVPLAFGGHTAEVVVGPPRDGSTFPPGLARSLVEMVIGQITLTYQRNDRPQIVDNLVYDLLLGRLPDEQAVARQAELAGLDLAPPRAVLLVDCLAAVAPPHGTDDPSSPGHADGLVAGTSTVNGHGPGGPAGNGHLVAQVVGSGHGVGAAAGNGAAGRNGHGPRPLAGTGGVETGRRGRRGTATLEPARAVVDAPRCEASDLARRVIETTVSFFRLPKATICSDLGNGEVAILKASDRHNLEAWAKADDPPPPFASWADLRALKRAATDLLAALQRETGMELSIGVGRYHPGLWGMRRSYWDAQHGLRIGRRVYGDGQVYLLPELGPAAFLGLADPKTKLELARHLLEPLAHEPVFYHTVVAYLAEDRSPSAVAEHLNIHRNTLNYRLDRVAASTGLDPRQFEAAVILRLCLLAIQL